MNNDVISPRETDKAIERLLDKMSVEFEPEIIPIEIESYAKESNCYINVAKKVKIDGGKIHYGWNIYKSKIICEAERHAVWEDRGGNLIDITPPLLDTKTIMFVSDNRYVNPDELIDNIRINITNNLLVDDFIYIYEKLESLYKHGVRIDDKSMMFPNPIKKLIDQYENMKLFFLGYIKQGNTEHSKCFCESGEKYKNCHGLILRKSIDNDIQNAVSKI